MAKVEIVPKDALSVGAKVNELVNGQKYPFQATLNHDYKRGIVLPRIGHADTILAKSDTVLTINSFEQAWELCSDLAHLASHHKREQFCTLSAAEPTPSEEVAPVAPEASAEPVNPAEPAATEQPKGAGKSTKVKEA